MLVFYALVFGGIRLDDEVMSIVTGTNSKQHIDHLSLPCSPLVIITSYLLQTDIRAQAHSTFDWILENAAWDEQFYAHPRFRNVGDTIASPGILRTNLSSY